MPKVSCQTLTWARVPLANQPYQHDTHLVPTHLRIDALAFGVLLSYGWHFGTLKEWSHTYHRCLCAGGLTLTVPAFIFPLVSTWWIPVFGFTVFYLGSGALLLGAIHLDMPRSGLMWWIARIGVYSYSIYLWHGIANIGARFLLSYGWQAYATAYLAGSIVGGMLTAKVIEVPSLAIRDRYFPAQSRKARPVEPPRTIG